MNRRNIIIAALILTSFAVGAQVDVMDTTTLQSAIKSVFVTNWPATQNVNGSVGVNNLPAVQNVAGTVNVGNLPTSQTVSGTVNVGNLPAVQTVTGTVSVDSIPAVPSEARPQFVGITASMFIGDEGLGTYTSACAAEFPDSRMCTSLEILETKNWPSPPVGIHTARVQPVLIGQGVDGATGIGGGAELSCQGWSNVNFFGGLAIVFDDTAIRPQNGSFKTYACGGLASVACCAPI